MDKQWGKKPPGATAALLGAAAQGARDKSAMLAGEQHGKAVEWQRELGRGLRQRAGGEAGQGTDAAGAASLSGGGLLLGGAAVWWHIGCRALGGLGGGGVGQGAAGKEGGGCALAAGGRDVRRGSGSGGQAGRHILSIRRQGGGGCCCLLAQRPGTGQGGGAGGTCPCPEGGEGGQLGQRSVNVHGGDAAAGGMGQLTRIAGLRIGRGQTGAEDA